MFKNVKRFVANVFNGAKFALLCPMAAISMATTALANGDTKGQIESLVNNGVDFVFNFTGGAIVIGGVFSMIMAIKKFIDATQARDGEQQREAGTGIGIALMIIALGAGVFALKTPLSDLVKSFFV